MFMGEYNHTIDAKGRLIIPAKFREPLGEEFVLTRGLDGCLYIYPMDEWEAFEEKLRALPLTNKDARAFSRFFVAGATTCELDKQGRILVPQTLREFAGLIKDVVLTGNLTRIEVWSKEKWLENSNYEDMDAKLKENKIHVAVFCNPHNPTGRVWEPEEIQKAMEVYKENDCIVIADEIWSDLILEGYHHTPVQSVSEDAKNRTIALYAPSKTFNLAGLIGSYHIIYHPYLRDRVLASSSKCHYNSMNVLSMHALVGAYQKEGQEWVDELRQVLSRNVDYAYNYILEHFEGISLAKPQGTYMLFLNCEEWCKKHGKTTDELLRAGWDVGVAWQDGRPFHAEYGIRVNLALPFSRVQEAFRRLNEYVF